MKRRRKYEIISFTDRGRELKNKLIRAMSEEEAFSKEAKDGGDYVDSEELCSENSDSNKLSTEASAEKDNLYEWTRERFKERNVLIFIGAIGIAVRAIAPFVKDKTKDPAVIVIDELGRFVIPVLSGHIGGAVECAREIADIIGATPVITTATDINGLFSVDVFADRNGLAINDMKKAKEFSASLLRHGRGTYAVDDEYAEFLDISDMPKELERVSFGAPCGELSEIMRLGTSDGDKTEREMAHFVISPRRDISGAGKGVLLLIPRCIVIGMGCRKGKSCEELYDFAEEMLGELRLSEKSVAAVVSADLKRGEEGLKRLAERFDCPFVTYDGDTLMAQEGDFTASDFVMEKTGSDNVCERAVMAHGCRKLIMGKKRRDGMTFAAGILPLRLIPDRRVRMPRSRP